MSIHMASPIGSSFSNDHDLLALLTSTSPQSPHFFDGISTGAPAGAEKGRYRRREGPLDPFLLAAAISSGPHVTRHHHFHHHQAIPASGEAQAETPTPTQLGSPSPPQAAVAVDSPVEASKPKYKSQQAPRSQKLVRQAGSEDKENQRQSQREPFGSAGNGPSPSPPVPSRKSRPRGPSLLQSQYSWVTRGQTGGSGPAVGGAGPPAPSPFIPSSSQPTLSKPIIRNLPPAPLQVQCMARTRIPTPHGPVFLHLYRNNKDDKEHLAFVVDPAQLEEDTDVSDERRKSFIRSASLDAKWAEDETGMDRLTRGAYVGRLTPSTHVASEPPSTSSDRTEAMAPPLVRIHSECFTGETIGSMRCDCGEQLDEALRLMSLGTSSSRGRGAVIYLRQEGRGIGLLSKIRAYNLQDMGHDTVEANLLLGHGADERRYDIAAAIMRDLGLGGQEDGEGSGVELLTNNPDKVISLEKEGIRVVKRREMVPRSWKQQPGSELAALLGHGQIPGATLIGGGAAHGPELEKYLRTKVDRMGHMLELPSSST